MNDRPLVAIACCFIAGASVPSLWQDAGSRAAAMGGIVVLLAACLLRGTLNRRLAALCLIALFTAFGERLWVDRHDHSALDALWSAKELSLQPTQAELTGIIATPPDVDGDVVTFWIAAKSVRDTDAATATSIRETVLVRIKLQSREEQASAMSWRRGETVWLTGTPERPGDAGNFGAFDYRAYLARQGVRWQWTLKGISNVRVTEDKMPPGMLSLRTIDGVRRQIGQLTDRLYPEGEYGYMKGLIVGITEEVDPAQYDQFSRLGLTHVLAISGLHVGVVVFVLLRLGAICRLTRERSIDIAFAAMPLYMAVTGASPSASRACLMAMIALALARKNRLKDGLHLLAAAGMAMVAWDPGVVENISFQLSFAVTAGLLLFTADAGRLLQGIRPKFVRDALAVGLTAQVVSFPLTIYYFHSIHLLSLPANLVIVPLVSFAVLPLGMASVVLGAMWLPLGMMPAALASYTNRITFAIVGWLNQAESLRMSWPQPPRAWVALAYVLIAVTVWLLRKRRASRTENAADLLDADVTAPLAQVSLPLKPIMRAGACLVTLVLLWGSWWMWGYQPAWLDRNAYVQFLDVGQGDSMLVRTGTGKHLLVDTGGTVSFRKPGDEWRERRDPYEIGRKLIVPLLRERGVRRLDALVLTHLDADHVGGAEAVLRDVPVDAIIWNGTWKDNDLTERLFRAAEARGIPVYAVRSGERWTLDSSTSLEVLYPMGGNTVDADDSSHPLPLPELDEQNELSVVLRMTLYGRTFLLTGDLEAPGEKRIVAKEMSRSEGAQLLLTPPAVDVMKVAHHGSKTSTSAEWLAWWHPANSVISVGRNNLYGHPHPTVVERIAEEGSLLLRTDEDGEIQYRISPNGDMQRRVKRPGGP